MAYSSLDQIFAAFPAAATGVGVGSFDIATVDVSSYYIYTSDGIIDSYLGRRYTTPVTPVPAVLTGLSVDIAIYKMFTDQSWKVPDVMNARYTNAMNMLERISMGKMTVPGAIEIDSGDQYAFSTNQQYHPVFSPVLDELDQSVDSDLVEEHRNDRIDDGDC